MGELGGISRTEDTSTAVGRLGLYVAFYNLCKTHEALKQTPAMALGLIDHVWTVGELIEAALKAVPTKPPPTLRRAVANSA